MKMSAVSASSMRRPLPFRAFRATSACLLTFAIASGLLAAPATAGPDSTSPPTEQGLQQPTPSASALAPEDAPVLAEQPAPVAEPALEVPSRLATPSNVPVEFAQSPSSPGATMGQVAKEQRAAVEGTNPAPLSGPANQAQADLVAPALAGIPAGVPGMDVSGWQADAATHSRSTVDWSWQRSMGSRFVYAKGSEGDYFADASRVSHLQGATATGMLHGAYHFALPSQSSATRQADFFLANGGSWKADGKTLPPLLDIENNPYPSLGNSCYGMSPASMVTWIKAFSNRILARTGRLPMIYTNYYWWQQCTGGSQEFGKQPLHIAAYGPPTPLVPSGWSTYSMWQFSDSGPYAGDSNVWNGTYSSLQKFASTATVTPSTPTTPPAPTTPPTPVFQPSIPSPADVVAADEAGALWLYPATGSGKLGARKRIGSGWTNLRSITVIDWNADGVLDIVAQWKKGTVTLYLGKRSSGFNAPTTLGVSGWQNYQLSIGYWLARSPYPQIIARSATGTLTHWGNHAGAGLSAGKDFSHGWASLSISMADLDGDGRQDLLAHDSTGGVKLYRSNGSGGFMGEARPTVKSGWQSVTSVSVASNFSGKASTGLITRTTNGNLTYHPVPGNNTLGTPLTVGTGWNSMLIAGGETLSATSGTESNPQPSIRAATDMLSIDAAGVLSRSGVSKGVISAREKIGSGHGNAISVHNIDWNKDATQDVVVQSGDGKILLYSGKPTGGFNSAQTIGPAGWANAHIAVGQWIKGAKYPGIVARLENGSMVSFGTTDGAKLVKQKTLGGSFARMHPMIVDFDGDGNADLLARDNVGQLNLYRSNGKGSLLSPSPKIVGKGWNVMNSVSPLPGMTSTSSTGLLARTTAGSLKYYPYSSSRFGAASTVSGQWQAHLLSGSRQLFTEQSLTSLADTASVDAAGGLWAYPATGTGQFSQPHQIGTGWNNARSIHVTDWNADTVPDILGQWSNGTVTVYLGHRSGGFAPALKVGSSGWSNINVVVAKWTADSVYPSVIGTDPHGNLRHWNNSAGRSLSNSTQIGSGWHSLRLAVADFSGNNKPDMLAVDSNGTMRLYRTDGLGRFVGEARPIIGTGWKSIKQFSTVNGFASPASQGLVAHRTTGESRYYPMTGNSGWGQTQPIDLRVAGNSISQ